MAPVHTLLMFLQYLGTSQPFIKQTYDLVHLVATTGHPLQDAPDQRHRRVMIQRCPPTRT
jgi:hypothetical protein